MTLVRQVEECISRLDAVLSELASLITPDMAKDDFFEIACQFVHLEHLLDHKEHLTTVIGYLADRHQAGNRVGSRTPEEYLMSIAPISRREAHKRITRGRDTYQPPTPVDVAPDTVTGKNPQAQSETAHHTIQQAHAAQRQAAQSFRDAPPPEEYLRILDAELSHLTGGALGQRHPIRAHSLEGWKRFAPDDFRKNVRNLVVQANRNHPDPYRGWRRRFLSIGQVDGDGGAKLTGYLPAPVLALMQDALAGTNQPGFPGIPTAVTSVENPEGASQDDRRTLAQRRLDGLAHLLHNRARHAVETSRGGIGSLVVSITAEELKEILTEDDSLRLRELACRRRPTSTGARVNLLELMKVGLARYDLALVHDARTGNPLCGGRAIRGATLMQKLALVASELVCSHPGCGMPAVNCDVHHITPWMEGGKTDIDNLTLLCRTHHMDNNDHRNPQLPRGWAARDPKTGRTGYHPAVTTKEFPPHHPCASPRTNTQSTAKTGSVIVNESLAARESAGHKIRRRWRTGQRAIREVPD